MGTTGFYKLDFDLEPTDEQLREVGGTLFLDEINSLDIGHQAKFLRIIQNKAVQVVGEERARKFDIKIICACNANIEELIFQGKFREDLYHRVGRGIIRLPALREMPESIIILAKLKVAELSNMIGITDKNVTISDELIDSFLSYSWPGNIRELDNVIYRGLKAIRLEDTDILQNKHIGELTRYNIPNYDNEPLTFFKGKSYDDSIKIFEKQYFKYLLDLHHGNQKKAAEFAKIGRSTLINRVKKYSL